LIALKTILKEIDPYAFEEALKLTPAAKKEFRIHQSDEERNQLDARWAKLNSKLSQNPGYKAPVVPFQ
jgi:hypothetical protein